MLFCSFEVLGQGALKGFVYWAIGRLFDLWVNLFCPQNGVASQLFVSTFRGTFYNKNLGQIWVKPGSNHFEARFCKGTNKEKQDRFRRIFNCEKRIFSQECPFPTGR